MKKIAKLIVPALTISLLVGCNFDDGNATTKPGIDPTRESYLNDNIIQIKPTGTSNLVEPSIGPSTDPTESTNPSTSSKPESTKPSSVTKPTLPTTTKPKPTTTKPKPTRPSNSAGKLEFTKYGLFSGIYPEGGEDEYVENVVALYVTNISPDYLEHAIIYYDINGSEAVFVVEGLQPGKSAWVMERTRMTIDPPYSFVHSGDQSSFQADNQKEASGINIRLESGYMVIKNETDEDLKDVVIRYKELFADQKEYPGVFSGGIVYNVRVGNIKAGETVRADADHCTPGSARVVRIDWS